MQYVMPDEIFNNNCVELCRGGIVSQSELCAKLDAMSPLKILARGYGVATKDGKIISDINSVRKGDKINVMLSGGDIGCEVTEVKVN